MNNKSGGMKLIENFHVMAKEKTSLIQMLVQILDRSDVQTKVEGILHFLNRDIIEHIEEEELLIEMAESKGVSPAQKEIIDEFLREHTELRSEIDAVNAAAKLFLYQNKEKREYFIKTIADLIESLSLHAAGEDERLIPLLRQMITADDLKKLAEHIAAKRKNTI